jgi:hypothetical protein
LLNKIVVLRQKPFIKPGKIVNAAIRAILRPNWEALKKRFNNVTVKI